RMHARLTVPGVIPEGDQDGVVESYSTTHAILAEQLGRLTRLIEDIDEVSRAQEHRIDIDLATEPLGELIHTAATTAQESYQVKGVGLPATDVSPAATVTVDRQRFGQVMSNLLANALRHTPAGGHVTISATQQGAGT